MARPPGWKRYVNRLIARDISKLARYYDQVLQWLPRTDDSGLLLDAVDAPERRRIESGEQFPDLTGEVTRRTVVLVNGAFNHDHDIQGRLMELHGRLARTARLLVVLYNPYLRFLYRLANRLGLRKGALPDTFVTRFDLQELARLSGFAIVRESTRVYCPFRLLGLGDLINRLLPLVPLVRWLSLTYLVILRPVIPSRPSGLTCVIPARNERGNIENALLRFPKLDCPVEIVFVEGHSTDGTWEEIQRVAKAYSDRFHIKVFQQAGQGKADAVRLGFAHAGESLLTILDADLTMPPERLSRFYEAWCNGHGDFVNGSRLVYPMEGEAMRFLNRLGNVFFAKALSWVLGTRLSDSLCGTKMLTRHDYQRMIAWRGDFGDFDPFGDFELLFPAAVLGLGTVDVPVRYMARTYGETNIRRFRHGLQLLKMTFVGLFRIKLSTGV
jgi:hypothetical protein